MRSLLSPVFVAFGAAALSLAIAGCSSAGTSESTTSSTDDALTGSSRGGIKNLTWNGQSLDRGLGGYYIIASCSGADHAATNLDSKGGTGVLEPPNGGPSTCGEPTYDISYQGTNPVTVTIDIGLARTTPSKTGDIGGLTITLDLDRALFPEFTWDAGAPGWAGGGWEAGCANDFKFVADGSFGLFAEIPAPCPVDNANGSLLGMVGVARRAPLEAGLGGTMTGPLASVHRHIDQVRVTAANGAAVDLAAAQVATNFTFISHPLTHAFGPGFTNLPAGTHIHMVETLTVGAPTIAPMPSGVLRAQGAIPGQSFTSPDGRYRFALRTSGDLEVQEVATATTLWSSHTSGLDASELRMQPDGNLVLYRDRAPDGSYAPVALWTSKTGGFPGASLSMQNDGNAVIYADGVARWATHSDQP